ncbi:hypothetical protein M8994_22035, partial [Brucella sp. 21LCYQ03]|nr:hypothetical protein [Brucella sp. 21LCYQ03]
MISAIVYTIGIPRVQSFFDNINAKPKKDGITREGELVLAEYENQKAYARKQSEIENTKANYREVQDLNQQLELLNNQLDDRNKTISNYALDIKSAKNKIDTLTFQKELDQSKLNLITNSHLELLDQLENFIVNLQ